MEEMDPGRLDRPTATTSDSTWGTRLRRRSSKPPRRFILASIGLHVFVVAAFYIAGARVPRLPEFETFRVNLISPPPTVQGEPEPVVTTTPVVPEPTPPEPPRPEPEPPRPQPVTPPRTQAPVPTPPQRQPDPPPARGPDPRPAPVGGENINVVQDGRDFQYPEYLNNIIIQLTRYFRPPEGLANLEAEVVFYINRDGSVGGIQISQTSGNFAFNAQAMQAVEQAGRARAFGPLPDGWQRDRLHISYTFERPR
jgi:TonB family protein